MRTTIHGGLELSQKIEDLLVARNLRGMAKIQPVLPPGYCLRAAKLMNACRGTVLIGTGFPVVGTFETDGPVGAISLYRAMEAIGAEPVLVCGAPLSAVLAKDYRVAEIAVGPQSGAERQAEAEQILARYTPDLVISIERPGQALDGDYYNMRGESIGLNSGCFDAVMNLTVCPTIAIGDGGNEIGMGNVRKALEELSIVPSATTCDELVVADVSNWGGHALVALLGWLQDRDLLADFDNRLELQYLSDRGSVDGVTRENTLTEDSLPADDGIKLIQQLRQLTGFVAQAKQQKV